MGIVVRHSILVAVYWCLAVHYMLLLLHLIAGIVEVCAHGLLWDTSCTVVRARTSNTILVRAKFRGLILAVVRFKL